MTSVHKAVGALLTVAALTLAGCASEGAEEKTPAVDRVLQEARSVNQSRHVSESFDAHPVVLDDPDGFASADLFFPTSEVLILADDTPQAQLRAASLAVVTHAPLIIYHSHQHAQVIREIERMATHTVFAVGDVPVLGYTEQLKVIKDPGGLEALEKATALRFEEAEVADPEQAVRAVASLNELEPTWLRATYGPKQHISKDAKEDVVPVRSRQDAEMAPQVIALPSTSIASIATARAFGANVYVTDEADPRQSHQTLVLTAGLSDKPLVALGAFGSDQELAARIKEAEGAIRPGDLNNISSLPQSPD